MLEAAMYGVLLEEGETKDLLGCQVSSIFVMSYNLFAKIKLHLYPLLAPEDSYTSVVIRNLLLVCGSGFIMDSNLFFFFLWLNLFQCEFILFHIGMIWVIRSIVGEVLAVLSPVH